MKLKEIAEIKTGIVLSRKKSIVVRDSDIEYRLLSIRHLAESGKVIADCKVFKSAEELNINSITKEGDIVIKMTEPYSAVFINQELSEMLVSSNMAIIRLSSKKYMAEFLTELINHQKNKIFYQLSAGTSLRSINTDHLKELAIPECNLAIQSIIVGYNKLHDNEMVLFMRMVSEKENILKTIMNKILIGEIQ